MSDQITRQQTKQERRRDEQRRREEERLRAARRKRNTVIGIIGAGILLVAVLVGVFFYSNLSSRPATVASISPGSPVDGITCDPSEGIVEHTHTHLVIYINGQQVQIPANIGIENSLNPPCLYWTHTHATTGVIHVESPVRKTYTLGNFFDIWGKQFSQLNYPLQADSSTGWTAYVNGVPYNGGFRNIPLTDQTSVTIAYNSPNITPEKSFDWAKWNALGSG